VIGVFHVVVGDYGGHALSSVVVAAAVVGAARGLYGASGAVSV
jgi:hypothetical protein